MLITLILLRFERWFSSCVDSANFHEIASFVTPDGQFEYLKMPFGVLVGLANVLVAFQKFISLIFKPLINSGKILLYLDDIFIATSSISENLDILKEVLKLLYRYKVK